jgi:hypothetical protein
LLRCYWIAVETLLIIFDYMFDEIVANVSTPVSKVIVGVVVIGDNLSRLSLLTAYKLSIASQKILLIDFFIFYIINVFTRLLSIGIVTFGTMTAMLRRQFRQ